jgi:hypothetical protein
MPFDDDMDDEIETDDFFDDGDLDVEVDLDDDDGDDGWEEEIAMEAGMLGGVEAYNEVRGYDVDEVEPCGQHCDWSCPRCGGE